MLARVRSNLTITDLLRAATPGAAEPIEALERAFSERFSFRHALLFPYARTALYALLLARGWRGREILCPAYICAEVPSAITQSGNEVRFVDSAADHFLPGAAEWRMASSTNAAMAVITPLFGYPVDKGAEAAIRGAAPDAFLLYDESQSYGAEDERGVQMRDADGALFSFGLGKMMTTLSGGLLLLRDTAIFQAVRALRDAQCSRPNLAHTMNLVAKGLAAWTGFREPALSVLDLAARRLRVLPVDAEDWTPTEGPRLPADGKIMPSAYQAKLGLHQLAKLDLFLTARKEIARYYENRLREEGLRTFDYARIPTWPRYPWPVARRDAVVSELHRHKIQVSIFLPYSCADLPVYRNRARACPNAALWGRSMINLPNWYGMEIDQAEQVVDMLLRLNEKDPRTVAWPATPDPNPPA
jgi:dTDP-4-amino-4,6-dideoxygalactose transaminase